MERRWVGQFGRRGLGAVLSMLVALVGATKFCGGAERAAPVVSAWADVAAKLSAKDRQRIEQALPTQPVVSPVKPRRLLLFDRNVGYPGHPSTAYSNFAFTRMGRKTGAYEAVISGYPEVFRPEYLAEFDAVFFNNTVGNLFRDRKLRQSLVDFVYRGGGLLGVHGTTVAFTWWPGAREDWPEFGLMLGARGANHRDSREHVFVKLDDPSHPLNACFPSSGFEYRDEFFRVHGPYSRNRLRVLFRIDTEKTDLNQGRPRGRCERADNDYALAWVRSYGRGRVFYCTIAHNPYVFWDPMMLRFYLGAIQFALGDLSAPTTPSARLTPAVRAQEKLGWRVGLMPQSNRKPPERTLFETIQRAARLGLSYVGAASDQIVSDHIARPFNGQLDEDALRQIRMKLGAEGVRLLTYRVPRVPADEAAADRLFRFCRRMGVEAILSDSPPVDCEEIERLCDRYDLKLAVCHLGDEEATAAVPKADCSASCRRIGRWTDTCVDGGDPRWKTAKLSDRVRQLRNRVVVVHIPHATAAEATPPPADERRAGATSSPLPSLPAAERFLNELGRLKISPVMLSVNDVEANRTEDPVAETVRWLNAVSIRAAEAIR
ncbi:MAG: ThuA domain-containing protein [Planctomycetes bacterium]|nr:ThuA domain-containing protein [Planctomycetota bacterium]